MDVGRSVGLYYYFFPLFMFLIRNAVQLIYWIMGFSTGLFLQIPLFIIGLEYGTILSVSVSDILFIIVSFRFVSLATYLHHFKFVPSSPCAEGQPCPICFLFSSFS